MKEKKMKQQKRKYEIKKEQDEHTTKIDPVQNKAVAAGRNRTEEKQEQTRTKTGKNILE